MVEKQDVNRVSFFQFDKVGEEPGAWAWHCNRGLLLHNLIANKTKCLCPPAYFGDLCEFQSERISITLQVRSNFDMRSVLTIILMLIKDDWIESHDQVIYSPFRECNVKFNLNLLHSSRPRNKSAKYAVRIQVFDKQSLVHRGSWIYPLQFTFLPVIPISLLLWLPPEQRRACFYSCSNHGICIPYENNDSYYCFCHPGWSGFDCSQSYNNCNQCSSDSLCIDSICVCPLSKLGPRCYISRFICNPNPCMNDGLCIPTDERISDNEFVCLCGEAFSGKRCEISNALIIISLRHVHSPIPFSILVHFIRVFEGISPHEQSTTFKKIPVNDDVVSLYWADPFHIIFVQLSSSYYLGLLQETHNPGMQAIISPFPFHQCLPIAKLFNESVLILHIIRRIKLYHVPCQELAELSCFYDEFYMCYCNRLRLANCFAFNQSTTSYCFGYNYCKNGGSCIQDNAECPQTVLCGCAECYYGSRCQFSTKGLGISLDPILGYHIRSGVTFNRQQTVVKVSMAVTILMWIIAMINGLLSILTFKDKTIREVGCTLYVLGSALASIFTLSFFFIKFILLFLSQSALITSWTLLKIQCLSIDFLLRLFLITDNWLNASVAVERIIMVSKGINFNKKKSKRAAKWIIPFIFLFGAATTVQDPFHRRLVNDREEKRIWCIVEYTDSWQKYDSFIILFHFLTPFSLNLISALFIIITAVRQRSNIGRQQSCIQHLKEQLQKNKQLLISPLILVILSLPRVIISFLPGCLKSQREPWLFLVGYFVPYLPPLLTFFVFVLPSKRYRNAFYEEAKRIRQKYTQCTTLSNTFNHQPPLL